MSVLISCQGLRKAYSFHNLFEDLSCTIDSGCKIGLIGPNGCGKSTFLKILAGQVEPDSGEVAVSKHTRVVYIAQDLQFPADQSVFEIVSRVGQGAAIAAEELHHHSNAVIRKTGFQDSSIKAGMLSGGWKKRLALACGLAQTPDIMLLDEPTNHLDVNGLLWLERLLQRASFGWVLVSHDRYFLENTATEIAELNPVFQHGFFRCTGAYQRFLEQRAAYLDSQQQQAQTLQNKVRRETEWLRKAPRARGSKARYRINQAYDLMNELKLVRARLKTSAEQASFSGSNRKTKQLLEVKDLKKSFDTNPIVSNLNLRLSPGSAVGLLGNNGSGKTTLLKMLSQQLSPDEGSVLPAPNLRIVYFDQHRAQLQSDQSVRETLCSDSDAVVYRGNSVHIVTWAKRFRFEKDQLDTPVSKLSGGEQARLLIARLMLEPADLLLLDEPTNDLDIAGREALEESLLDFPGALVLVCHDRYMLNRVCTGFIGITDGRCMAYADYNQWEASLQENKRTEAKAIQKKKASAKTRVTGRLSYMEEREYGLLETQIAAFEKSISELQGVLNDSAIASDPVRLRETHAELQAQEEKLEGCYSRWEKLEGKKGKKGK